MLPQVAVLKEVSYKEYAEHIHDVNSVYSRQFIIPEDMNDPEEIANFVIDNLNNPYNSDIHKYYRGVGLITTDERIKEEKKLDELKLSN